MINTVKILEYLNIDDRFLKLIEGKIKVPYLEDFLPKALDFWYPHPPFLTLFSNNELMFDSLRINPFVKGEYNFVIFYLEADALSEEYLNFNQFITKIILRMMMLNEGEDNIVDEKIAKFIKDIGFDEILNLENFMLTYGDDEKFFKTLTYFKNSLPIELCKDIKTYNGNYFASEDFLNTPRLNAASSYDIYDSSLLIGVDEVPVWLQKGVNQKQLFYDYLESGDFEKAWLVLNGRDWALEDVAEGMRVFQGKTDNELFHLIAENWLHGYEKSLLY